MTAAIGGSTNAVIHLAAIAGRLGLDASLRRFDELWRDVPLVADIEPCGTRLIQHFRTAGGIAAVARSLGSRFDTTALSADGTDWAALAAAAPELGTTIRPADDPVLPAPTLAAVFGSLAPDGAVIKVAAATPGLLSHTGRAVTFDTYQQMRERLDDESEQIDASDVIVVRGCGPVGVPGMPEWGMAPVPRRLARAGVRDMVRISDGRMSGTAYGTVILHVTPEAADGGPLGLVCTGDTVILDVAARRLDIDVSPEELAARRPSGATEAGFARPERGWEKLYVEHVTQADTGADLDFLRGSSGHQVPRESH